MIKLSTKFFAIKNKVKKYLFKEHIYKSYQEALENCTKKGYENQDVISAVKAKALSYRNVINENHFLKINIGVIALLDVFKRLPTSLNRIVIFDFGGADGIYYLQLRRCLPVETNLLWCVIETPEMVTAMKDLETDELKFFASSKEALIYAGNQPQIFHTSGAIQYTPDPLFFISDICGSGAPYLIFNRQSLNGSGRSIISIQTSLLSWHGEGILPGNFNDRVIEYPHTNISKIEFEQILLEKYVILYTFDDPSGVKKVNKEDIVGLCYACELKTFKQTTFEPVHS